MSETDRKLAPATAETFTGFAITEAKYEQNSLLDGNSGSSTIELIGHAGHFEFSADPNQATVTLTGASEHQELASALRWLADRIEGAA